MPLAQLLGLILLISYLSFGLMGALAQLSKSSYFLFRLFLWPGVMLHELSHMAACIVTFTPITGFSFWDEQGGHVRHHVPVLPWLTQPLISVAPFPVGIAALTYISQYVQAGHDLRFTIPAGLLGLSIAATLSPSKADLSAALAGTILLILGLAATVYWQPSFITGLWPALTAVNNQLMFIAALLAGSWFIISFGHGLTRQLMR